MPGEQSNADRWSRISLLPLIATAAFAVVTITVACAPTAAQSGRGAVSTSEVPIGRRRQRSDVSRLRDAIIDADFRGQLDRLESLQAELLPYEAVDSLASLARYWRGFALWRRALNAANDGAPPESIVRDHERALREFRIALRHDTSDIEAKIGAASAMLNIAYFIREQDPARFPLLMREANALLGDVRRADPRNPRFAFVESARLFWLPAEFGGDQRHAIALLDSSLLALPSRKEPGDSLGPRWGEAEVHMQLAWLHSNLSPAANELARVHATQALSLQPQWRFVKDVLIPRINRR
jgi:hypothetical protein